MVDAWLEVSSSHYDSHCGDDDVHTIEEALDGSDYWNHAVDEEHWFILDLGQTYTVKKLRGRSYTTDDPTEVDVYVSDSKVDWGTAVATGIGTWQDTTEWQEVDCTDKDGRYVKVVIKDTEDYLNYVGWGKTATPFMTIFDVYGDVAAGESKVPVFMAHYRRMRQR